MTKPDLFTETNRSTYCPEDNKLRLYVGRVPREEYEALRAEGWTSTPKQTCDFVAHWTPERRNTCESYAGIIEDEDMGPDERAADRAERFSGYRDKRENEAGGHADRYEAGPSAHGYQSQARAERAASRHDRIGTRAVDSWSKAEYWTSRTAGVISHALHVSSPDVRMGRIKTLETELRGLRARWAQACGPMSVGAAEWCLHLELRLAYENQMLEAQGGRLAHAEIVVGGKIGNKLIIRVNKSPVTGRVTSVDLLGPKVQGWAYQVRNIPGTEFAAYTFATERMHPDAYQPPTPESLAELAAFKGEKKAKAPVKDPCPLINPTDADAERLQAAINERQRASHIESHLRRYSRDYAEEFKPAAVLRITQAQYSAHSKGAYARIETRGVCRGAQFAPNCYNSREKIKAMGGLVCMVRRAYGGNANGYGFDQVIILTDKPQRPLPVAVWQALESEVTA